MKKKSNEGKLEGLENCKILMIQRGEHAEHGPFYSFILEQGDILVISTSREQTYINFVAKYWFDRII